MTWDGRYCPAGRMRNDMGPTKKRCARSAVLKTQLLSCRRISRHRNRCVQFTAHTRYIWTYWWHMPSVLWRCWLGGRKGIRPVKNWVVGCWRGYLSGARCRLAYGPADAILPLTVSCFSKIQIGFTFLVPAHLDSPRKSAVKQVCLCVCDDTVLAASIYSILLVGSYQLHKVWYSV